jgi:hypothetical protein
MKHKMPIQLQMWGNTGHDQTKSYQTKPSGKATKIPKPRQMEIFTAGPQDPEVF